MELIARYVLAKIDNSSSSDSSDLTAGFSTDENMTSAMTMLARNYSHDDTATMTPTEIAGYVAEYIDIINVKNKANNIGYNVPETCKAFARELISERTEL